MFFQYMSSFLSCMHSLFETTAVYNHKGSGKQSTFIRANSTLNVWKSEANILHLLPYCMVGQKATDTSCSERLWNPCPCRHSKPDWMQPWASWSNQAWIWTRWLPEVFSNLKNFMMLYLFLSSENYFLISYTLSFRYVTAIMYFHINICIAY